VTTTRRPTTTVAGGESPRDRKRRGRALRDEVPLAGHAELGIRAADRDPVRLLEEQAGTRVPELVPIRYGRMSVSPFTFFRGAARVMAADLAGAPRTGLTTQLCGDAHLSNFGFFASPERRLVFDLNDFDETLPGPFEWDVKRLVASLAVAGRDNGHSRAERRTVVSSAAATYRTAMAEFAAMRELDVWYSHADVDTLRERAWPQLDPGRRKKLDKAFDRARGKDHLRAFGRLTTLDAQGRPRIVGEPPLVVPVRTLLDSDAEAELEQGFTRLMHGYAETLPLQYRTLLGRYRLVDMARKVVGVGSVGTRCWILLLVGRDEDDPLLLQAKEAPPSVLAEFVGRSRYLNQGHRVVAGQRLMQQSGDIFLGWHRTAGIDGISRDFYVRQLWDWKGSIAIEDLRPEGLRMYAQLCAWTLARAHACTGDRIAIAGYLGSSEAFDQALVEYAEGYADVNEKDHHALVDAVSGGRIQARSDL
jgi:Uncharacterized protein conserved in bacteria (DUF2252)